MINRRDVVTAGAAATAVFSMSALAHDDKAAKTPTPPSGIAAHQAVYDATLECLRTGTVCLDHCIRSLSTGSTMMAECAGTVRAMLATCEATRDLAMLDNKNFKALAAVCAKVCRDCEAACKKHSGMHAECKACMESCAKCAEACEKA
ncbi:MAG: Csp1 family four helix bundle copper storage protein [Archangium sp.]